MNAQPDTDYLWRFPQLAGTISAYQFHLESDNDFVNGKL